MSILRFSVVYGASLVKIISGEISPRREVLRCHDVAKFSG